MKSTIQITLVALLLSSALISNGEAIDPGPSKYKDLFTLKADKDLVGAQVRERDRHGPDNTSI